MFVAVRAMLSVRDCISCNTWSSSGAGVVTTATNDIHIVGAHCAHGGRQWAAHRRQGSICVLYMQLRSNVAIDIWTKYNDEIWMAAIGQLLDTNCQAGCRLPREFHIAK